MASKLTRPNVKHYRIAEAAARAEGASSVTWESGTKHNVMVVSFANGLVVRQTLPKGRPAHDQWWDHWTRQRMRREMRAYLSTTTKSGNSGNGATCPRQ
jgi:hypothetical protein